MGRKIATTAEVVNVQKSEVEVIEPLRVPMRELPSPTYFDMDDPIFNAIWDVIKHWDIMIPQYYNGITSGNGSHVMLILNEVRIAMREKKIDDIIK